MDAISRLDEERILLSQQKQSAARESSPTDERGRLLQQKGRIENELVDLKRKYTDTYPDVVSLKIQMESLNARLAALPEPPAGSPEAYDPGTQLRLSLIGKEIERHKQELESLQRQIGSYQGKVQSVPVLETQLAELTRNYETSRQNYQSLLDKRLSAGMSEDLEKKQQAERFMPLDPAKTPEKPFTPKRLPIMAGVLVGSILLSAGVTILRSRLNGAIRSQADLNAILPARVAILGTIPPIASEADMSHTRRLTLELAIASLLACAALIAFLMRVKPIL